MGLRGPAPKPSVIEISQGCPGKRKPSEREPKPRELSPADLEDAPEGYDQRECKWWAYYSEVLGSMRVLTEADRTALATLAKASAEREENDEHLRISGTITQYPKGTGPVRISPVYKVGIAMRDRELKLLREFGLTPSARTRVQMVGDLGNRDELDDAIFGT
jgi:P27 family predicted phage terminase small subunit